MGLLYIILIFVIEIVILLTGIISLVSEMAVSMAILPLLKSIKKNSSVTNIQRIFMRI